MDQLITARAADTLRRSRHVALPLDDLAARLGVHDPLPGPAALERALRADPRFRLIHEEQPLPGLDAWSPGELAAYEPALRAAGLSPSPLVVLLESNGCTLGVRGAGGGPAVGPGASAAPDAVRSLLHVTLSTLLQAGPAPGFVRAACRAAAAINPPASS